jgi:hypothetical protein
MNLNELKQAPLNTTMMGVLRGALDYYRIPISNAYLFGASGHAFLLNIHPMLCPSSPYCWNFAPMIRLIHNLGINLTNQGVFHSKSSMEERAAVEAIIRKYLEKGIPCYLLNMENQLITGYDETGFITAQPWPPHNFPPAHLTFGAWDELGEEIHVSFFVLKKNVPKQRFECIFESLQYAVDLWRNSKAHTSEPYGAGPNGYANWRKAIQDGNGNEHGGWWNGIVWSECRAHASEFFHEIASELPLPSDVNALTLDYAEISDLIIRCSNKDLDRNIKLPLLEKADKLESVCIERIEKILERFEK